MAARKNGVYLADEDGGESGSERSWLMSWLREAAVAQFSSTVAVVPSGTPHTLHFRGFNLTIYVHMNRANLILCPKKVPLFASAVCQP